ncbi:hypothetical protein SAMN02799624_02125 [Paenibacillus sp. UNC496MF]|uniref:hypothetical protein n=1 Tax=Paenibacillus sp. UNC496MF TaxID=1502753 RepID=UPI0008ECC270|nr:hypothetical protein [Paenibacillus sp. UNC496MF]SFI77537.1 hypothetical protein SAMN02799624_02125 [Paenibacillus sp. UNC496MF]
MQQLIILVLVGFVGYRIVRRVKGNFSWSAIRPGRMGTRMLLLAAVGAIFLAEGGFGAVGVVSDILGILIGAALGIVGAAMTSYERRGADLYYKGNAWIGGIVTVLFIGRLGYRVYEMTTASGGGGWSSASFAAGRSGWASGLMLIMFAYYIVYYALLLRQGKGAPVRTR